MSKLEILKRQSADNEHCGLKFMNRIILPCMYSLDDLENIIDVDNIYSRAMNTIYVFKGYKNGHYVYGLYNTFLNDFVKLEYDEIREQGDNFILVSGKDEAFYDTRIGLSNYTLVDSGLEIVQEAGKYGLKNFFGDYKIPCNYEKEDLYGIAVLSEVLPKVYILYSLSVTKIVGIFDANNGKLIRGEFTSYDVVKGVVVLKNKVAVQGKDIQSKTFLSLYDSKHAKYVTGNYHDTEKAITDRETSEFCSGLREQGGVFILKKGGIHGSHALYDSKTGYLKKGILCGDFGFSDGLNSHKLVVLSAKKSEFLGLYDIKEGRLEKYCRVFIEDKKNLANNYLSEDVFDLYVSVDNPNSMLYKFVCRYYPVEVFSDFLRIRKGQTELIFARDYTLVATLKSKNTITELSHRLIELLGVPTDERGTAYLVNGVLSYFKPNLIIFSDDYMRIPFTSVPKTLVASAEFEYGIGLVEASSVAELNHELEIIESECEEIEDRMKSTYENNRVLQLEYPNLAKKGK